jgi:4,5-DOPA dioxygenase extradiol
MSRLPTVFLSHGAPTLPIDPTMPRAEFARLADRWPRPRAILVMSAHWASAEPVASIADKPETIHDFYGFPRELYELTYDAPGAPAAATRATVLLRDAGIAAATASRGLDHGAWVPLMMLYPQADIPVAQVSIQPHRDPAYHYRVGRALRSLRDEGVLIVGSGQITHNLRAMSFSATPEEADPRVTQFTDWFEARMHAHDIDALLAYRSQAPHAILMHPSDEHLLPAYVALGAADDDYGLDVQSLGTYQKVLAMTNYIFGSAHA